MLKIPCGGFELDESSFSLENKKLSTQPVNWNNLIDKPFSSEFVEETKTSDTTRLWYADTSEVTPSTPDNTNAQWLLISNLGDYTIPDVEDFGKYKFYFEGPQIIASVPFGATWKSCHYSDGTAVYSNCSAYGNLGLVDAAYDDDGGNYCILLHPVDRGYSKVNFYIRNGKSTVGGLSATKNGETWVETVEIVHAIDPKYIVLTSPNGTKYNLSVADDGTLSAVATN